METFRSGFVSIVGKPNVGKSTLMNKLVGENVSIISAKAQTTRHRIMGIINGNDYQVVYSDTPGILEPKYSLHEAMMTYVKVSLEDADVIVLVVTADDNADPEIYDRFSAISTPVLLVINKIDLVDKVSLPNKISLWKEKIKSIKEVLTVSAKTGKGVDQLLPRILEMIPVHPPFFPADEFTDRSERFFAAEMIREKIFTNYEQEIPYSCEVGIESFKEEKDIIRISAIIYVERQSQKGIVIGKAGSSLKKVGMEARKDMEAFFAKKVFLETHVKVAENWRKEKFKLRQFGYLE
jgi:GTPase